MGNPRHHDEWLHLHWEITDQHTRWIRRRSEAASEERPDDWRERKTDAGIPARVPAMTIQTARPGRFRTASWGNTNSHIPPSHHSTTSRAVWQDQSGDNRSCEPPLWRLPAWEDTPRDSRRACSTTCGRPTDRKPSEAEEQESADSQGSAARTGPMRRQTRPAFATFGPGTTRGS